MRKTGFGMASVRQDVLDGRGIVTLDMLAKEMGVYDKIHWGSKNSFHELRDEMCRAELDRHMAEH
jgi:hypothetical protein